MRIVVVGAGGLGSYVAAQLVRAGRDVALVARGEHARRVRNDGLEVREPNGAYTVRMRCIDGALDARSPDLAILAVKAFSLEEVTPDLRRLARSGTTVVSLLNGVDAIDQLVEGGVPTSRVLAGIAYLTAFRTRPGVVERSGGHARLVVGSPGPTPVEALRLAVEAFHGTGVEVEEAVDLQAELWRKMTVVCALCVLCGLTRGSLGTIRGLELGPSLQERAVHEVLDVARAAGVRFPPGEASRVSSLLDDLPDDFHPSLVHDLNSGRPTEVDALCGAVARRARASGIATPLHDAATCAVLAAEGRARGSGALPFS